MPDTLQVRWSVICDRLYNNAFTRHQRIFIVGTSFLIAMNFSGRFLEYRL
ncbi:MULTISPECIES: hypothetical protein [Nostocaceae]|nr:MULTISPECIES: hypothetical protein [Nostocaceae]MBD2476752.1 hypothetical protein [Anabaena sp. FACHB-83]